MAKTDKTSYNKENSSPEPITQKVLLEAIQDTQTIGGEFIAKGTRMTVDRETATAQLSELHPHFKEVFED